MSLRDKQQNIQKQLDFPDALTGEAREAGREETESSPAASGTEDPARTDRLMEEVCEPENLKEALRQVKANKGSAGIDRMTAGQLADYLKQYWPTIREQLLSGEPTNQSRSVGWKSRSRTEACVSSAFRPCWIDLSSRR
jgi:RNA-directed DNA polymerase